MKCLMTWWKVSLLMGLVVNACQGVWAGPKTWDPGEPLIGSISAPANKATVSAGKSIGCSATGSDPSDHWTRVSPPPLEGWEGGDSVIYTWSASGGSFPNGNEGASVTWKAPDSPPTPDGKVTISVTIDDIPRTITSPDSGSTDDASLPLSVSITVVAAGLSLASEEDAICGGAKGYADPNPHRTKITATLTDSDGNPKANETINFSVTGPSVAISPSVSPSSATTDSRGVAKTVLLSGDKTGTATVKATWGFVETTLDVTIGAPDGVASINPESLPADGQSTATVSSTWTFNLDTIMSHEIHWRISKIWDETGVLIYDPDNNLDNRPQDSNYGSISPSQISTNGDGLAPTTYTVGTSAGTIEFEASDHSVTTNSWPEASASGSSTKPKFTITKPTASQDFRLNNVSNRASFEFKGILKDKDGNDISSQATEFRYNTKLYWTRNPAKYSFGHRIVDTAPPTSKFYDYTRGDRLKVTGEAVYQGMRIQASNKPYPVLAKIGGQNSTHDQIKAVWPGTGTNLILKAMAWVESSWQQYESDGTVRESNKGGRGLMQVTPTYEDNTVLPLDYWEVAWDWRYNLTAGKRIYNYMYDKASDYSGVERENRAIRAYIMNEQSIPDGTAAQVANHSYVKAVRDAMQTQPWND